MVAAKGSLLDPEFLAHIERLTLVARSTLVGQTRGERRSRRRGYSNEFADYRDYVPGDDLRYLDWNIYGRLERLFVKLFHEEEDLTVSIVVDVSRSMAYGHPQKLRYALQVTASLAYIALSGDDRVGVYPFAGELRAPFRPVRGRRNAPRLFRYLEDLLETPGEATDLARSLSGFAHTSRSRGLIVLISDLLDPAGYESALRTIAGGRADSFLIHVLAPEEVDPQVRGDLRLVDSEDGATSEISVDRRLLESYRATVAAFRAGVQQACSKRRIVPLFAVTSTPFEQLVLGYLRMRGLLQ
ncbi:MAG: DUF58 domain-containing protein [Planctomycetota bacterium]